jgi:hypothetical protein
MKAGSFSRRSRQPLDTELRLSRKQSHTADLEWSDILGSGWVVTNSDTKTNKTSHMASDLDNLNSHVQNCSRQAQQ